LQSIPVVPVRLSQRQIILIATGVKAIIEGTFSARWFQAQSGTLIRMKDRVGKRPTLFDSAMFNLIVALWEKLRPIQGGE
jgi:hypothetical protein